RRHAGDRVPRRALPAASRGADRPGGRVPVHDDGPPRPPRLLRPDASGGTRSAGGSRATRRAPHTTKAPAERRGAFVVRVGSLVDLLLDFLGVDVARVEPERAG